MDQGVPWTEDDLTSEDQARRATHSEADARELRALAARLDEGFGVTAEGSLLDYARRLAEERTESKLRVRELEAAIAAHRERWEYSNGTDPNRARPADLALWKAVE